MDSFDTKRRFIHEVHRLRQELLLAGFSVRKVSVVDFADWANVLGRCHHVSSSLCELRFANSLLAIFDTIDGYATCKETILHELVHAMPDSGTGHGKAFQSLAKRVNAKFGVNIGSHCSDSTIGAFRRENERQKKYKYFLSCRKGCFVDYFTRAGNTVKHPDRYRCKFCKGKLISGSVNGCDNCLAKIDSFRGEYAFLSNMFFTPFVVNGIHYTCVESAFQSFKLADKAERIKFSPLNGSEAKKLGKRVSLRSDWEEIKTEIMFRLLKKKFEIPALREQLLATGNAELVEGNDWGDIFWGVDRTLGGKNMLGKMLMKIRETLRET